MKTQNSIVKRANELYAAGRCDEAVDLLSAALTHDGVTAGIRERLAELLIDSDRHGSALQVLQNFALSDDNPSVSLLRAICHEALGEPAAAENIADELLRNKQVRADALALKGRLALSSKQLQQAETFFKEAIDCSQGSGMAWHGVAALLRQQQDEKGFFESLRNAFRCSPESRDIAISFHDVSADARRLPEIVAAFREAISHHPMNRRLRFLLIDLLLRQTKFSEAMSEIESVLVDFGVDPGVIAAGLKVRERLGGARILEGPPSDGSVSLCMIVRNEKDHLARCLRSAAPLVNEIIVVDTGSTDETKEIARVFGARVYHFQWADDFSKARNHALSKAGGDWILVLDADEVLSRKDDEEFRHALAMCPSRPSAYRIQTRNYTFRVNAVGFNSNRGEYTEEIGLGWYPSDKVRLFTNDARIRFDYPVHELVEPSLQRQNISVIDCPVVVHHYGTMEERHTLEKTKKYQVLARKKLKRGLNDKAALRELAVQASQVGNHPKALELWGRFIKLQPGSAEAYINMGTVCCNLGRLEAAVAFAHKALNLNPALKEAKFNKAIALLLMGRAGEAKTLLERLSEEQPGYLPARFLLCVAYVCIQEAASAENAFERLKALPMGEHIGEAFLDVARRFLSVSRRDYALLTLEAALHFGCASTEMRAVYEGCNAGALGS